MINFQKPRASATAMRRPTETDPIGSNNATSGATTAIRRAVQVQWLGFRGLASRPLSGRLAGSVIRPGNRVELTP